MTHRGMNYTRYLSALWKQRSPGDAPVSCIEVAATILKIPQPVPLTDISNDYETGKHCPTFWSRSQRVSPDGILFGGPPAKPGRTLCTFSPCVARVTKQAIREAKTRRKATTEGRAAL